MTARGLDAFLPEHDFNEVHAIRIDAPPARILDAVHEVTPAEIRLFRFLTWLRYPLRRHPSGVSHRPLLEIALRSGFVLLAEEHGREVVLGVAGRFWTSHGSVPLAGPEAFRDFDRPGSARAAIDFRVEEEATGRCRLTTETRILGTDAAGRRRFAAYWCLVHPGSAFIRRMWLRAIKARAEAL
jgi:hypothetical protein